MKKLFGEQKKQVEFTAEELENAKKVISAMQDKNVDIVVKVEGQKKKERGKQYVFQTSVALTTEQEKLMKTFCAKNNVKIAEVMRTAFDEFMLNHAA